MDKHPNFNVEAIYLNAGIISYSFARNNQCRNWKMLLNYCNVIWWWRAAAAIHLAHVQQQNNIVQPHQPDRANFLLKLLPQNQKLTKFTGKNVFASDFGNCLKVANSDKFLEWIQLRNAEAGSSGVTFVTFVQTLLIINGNNGSAEAAGWFNECVTVTSRSGVPTP